MKQRTASVSRETKETSVSVTLSLDGKGETRIDTGVGFADHMLTLLAFWAGFDLTVACKGDLEVDAHHTLEDVGLCLGQALLEAAGSKDGIERVGSARVPMDEALAEIDLDLSGRPYFVYLENTLPPSIAGEEKDVWREMLKSFAFSGKMNLHVHFLYGQNGHHLLEAAFKAMGLALRRALAVGRTGATSTKGSLDS